MEQPVQQAVPTEAMPPRGVGGWLLLFLISLLFISPAYQIYVLYNEWKLYHTVPSSLLFNFLRMPQPFDIFKIAKDGEPVWLEAAQSLEAAAKRVNTQRDCALGDYMIFSQRTTMSTGFLDRLATQLKVNKNPACRRGIQRILAALKKNFEDRKYQSHVEAESDFRQLVSREEACK